MPAVPPAAASADSEILDLLKSGPPPAAPPAPPSSSAGESITFGGVVSSDKIDVSSPSEFSNNSSQKLAKLFYVPEEQDHEDSEVLCCGFVGQGQYSFCVKRKENCSSHKNQGIHFRMRFKPKGGAFYVARTDGRSHSAWCHLCLTKDQADAYKEVNGSLPLLADFDQWKAVINAASNIKEGDTKDGLKRKLESLLHPPRDVKDLKTPSKFLKSQEAGMDKDDVSSASSSGSPFVNLGNEFGDTMFDVSVDELVAWLTSGSPGPFAEHYLDVIRVIKATREKLVDISSETKKFANVSDVGSDLAGIMTSLASIKFNIGPRELVPAYPDLWSAIADLKKALDLQSVTNQQLSSTHSSYVTKNDNQWKDLVNNWLPEIAAHSQTLASIQGTLLNMETELTRKDSKLDHVSEILGRAPGCSDKLNSTDKLSYLSDVLKRLSFLEKGFGTWGLDGASSIQSKLNSAMSDHQQELKSYIREVIPTMTSASGHSLRYKHWSFENEEYLADWLRTKGMSHPSWGLFVDFISFSEMFGSNHYHERSGILSDQYAMSKTGYDTAEEAIVAASFQNLAPSAYGKFKTSKGIVTSTDDAEFDSQEELPGLGSYNKWDGQDGSTGRKFILGRESRNAYANIEIKQNADLTGEVLDLARSLLVDSRSFMDLFNNHVGNSYQDTLNAGHYSEAQAWKLTCKQMKRVFLDLYEVRSAARDSFRPQDKWATTAKYIATTIRAHEVMAAYASHAIKDHPNISAEMTKFVCYSRPMNSSEELLTKLEAMASNVKQAQSATSKAENRLKKLETWMNDTDKLLKKLKDKAGI